MTLEPLKPRRLSKPTAKGGSQLDRGKAEFRKWLSLGPAKCRKTSPSHPILRILQKENKNEFLRLKNKRLGSVWTLLNNQNHMKIPKKEFREERLEQRSCKRDTARRRRGDEREGGGQKILPVTAGAVGQLAQIRHQMGRFCIALETRHV